MTKTRLLLPFTGSINALALSYAIQLAEHRHATLVLLALVRVKPGQAARLEHIQQAQDFLEFARCKAGRQGVSVERARIFTGNVARSIEAVAGEMNCEAVILFLSASDEALLEFTEITDLMDHAACNAHVVLLPFKPRRERKHPLHVPLLKRSQHEMVSARSSALAALARGQQSFDQHLLSEDELH